MHVRVHVWVRAYVCVCARVRVLDIEDVFFTKGQTDMCKEPRQSGT